MSEPSVVSGGQRATYEYASVRDLNADELQRMTRVFFDEQAPSYDAFDTTVQRRRLYHNAVDALVFERLSLLDSCERVLSFGCGTGRREATLKEKLGRCEIIGVEYSTVMAALAREHGIVTYSSVAEASKAIQPSSIDAAICLYSFGHLAGPSARLACLRRLALLLRQGAMLILDVFNLFDQHEWTSKLSDGGTGAPPPKEGVNRGDVLYRRLGSSTTSYMHYFTVGEITGLVEKAGFTVVHLTAIGHGYKPGTIGVPLNEGCLVLAAQLVGKVD